MLYGSAEPLKCATLSHQDESNNGDDLDKEIVFMEKSQSIEQSVTTEKL